MLARRLRQQPLDAGPDVRGGDEPRLLDAGRADRARSATSTGTSRAGDFYPLLLVEPAAVPLAVRGRQHGARGGGRARRLRVVALGRWSGGRRRRDVTRSPGRAGGDRSTAWYAWPARNSVASSKARPMSWRPTGRPSAKPQGTESPGMPARLAGTVKMSARYICQRVGGLLAEAGTRATASSAWPPRRRPRSAASKSRRISVRTFCARR